jgi:hypothetical protein
MMPGVKVKPLQPPFDGDVVTFVLASGDKLAVSHADAAKINALLAGAPEGRHVVLSAPATGDEILVEAVLQ